MKTALSRFCVRPSVVLAVSIALAGCGRQQQAPAPALLNAPTFKLTAAAGGGQLLVSGSVISRNRVELASRLSGYVTRVAVSEGQRVVRGQLLLQIDPAEVRGQLGQAQAALAAASAARATVAADTRRYGALFQDAVIARQQWEQQQLRDQQAAQQLAAAKSAYDQAAAQLAYASLRAPVDGLVVQKMVNPGDLASPGRSLLVLDGDGPMQVSSQVDDAVYAGIKPGDSAQVLADSGRCNARVAQLVPAQDPLSHTHLVKLDLAPGCALASGSFVEVAFTTPAAAPQLLLPLAAVVERAGMRGAFVVSADGTAQFRLLRLGDRVGDAVVVQAGLEPGQTVVVGQLERVENGVPIAGVRP